MATTTHSGSYTAPAREEGKVAKAIEHETSKLPSDLFLWSAVGSALVSLGLQAAHKKQASNFVGHWVPTLLILGLYNKTVKVLGHDSKNRSMH
jgi:hypothetical protein